VAILTDALPDGHPAREEAAATLEKIRTQAGA
jgi:hypothetical protein